MTLAASVLKPCVDLFSLSAVLFLLFKEKELNKYVVLQNNTVEEKSGLSLHVLDMNLY